MARIIELILTEVVHGRGVEEDPVRSCPQLWTKDGKLVAEADPFKGKSFFLPDNLTEALAGQIAR